MVQVHSAYKSVVDSIVLQLIKTAKCREQITYQELGQEVGVHHHALGPRLYEVGEICSELRYPPLSILVVNKKTGKPGGGFHKSFSNMPGYAAVTKDNEDQFLGPMRGAVWSVTDWGPLLQWMGLEPVQSNEDSFIKLDDDLLKNKALEANPYPTHEQTSSIQHARNAYVVEYAKRRSKGICQLCDQHAPFVDSKGSPFLEVHHIHWLSKGGQDSIYNVAALCPNCHRKMHIVEDPNDVKKLKEIAKSTWL